MRLRTLDGSALVIFPREMAPQLYDHMLETCRDNGFLPSAIRHARNPHFVHGLVMPGLGAHLNEEPYDELPAGLVWRPIDEPRLTWSTSAVWLQAQGGEAVTAFAEAALAGLRSVGHA
ncbi:LysR substrate-binding domain-containing protein [Nonomuraea sp. NPDC004297]